MASWSPRPATRVRREDWQLDRVTLDIRILEEIEVSSAVPPLISETGSEIMSGDIDHCREAGNLSSDGPAIHDWETRVSV